MYQAFQAKRENRHKYAFSRAIVIARSYVSLVLFMRLAYYFSAGLYLCVCPKVARFSGQMQLNETGNVFLKSICWLKMWVEDDAGGYLWEEICGFNRQTFGLRRNFLNVLGVRARQEKTNRSAATLYIPKSLVGRGKIVDVIGFLIRAWLYGEYILKNEVMEYADGHAAP